MKSTAKTRTTIHNDILKPVSLARLDVQGDLAVRSVMNYARLEGKWYRPWEVFSADQHGWPADWEGRIILALVSQAQATHRPPAWLDQIIDGVPGNFNTRGYYGVICQEGASDEQQLAGHSWLLRGLIAHYEWKKDRRVLGWIEQILRNLVLPAKENYRRYPVCQADIANLQGWVLSKLQSKGKSHALSGDLGCGFIALDGVSDAYRLLRWPELKELAEVMIERFLKIDLEGLHVQTHATLSALRGIIRFAEVTGNTTHLAAACRIFDRYKAVAMTEHYGNYNWWGKPRWTEPCGIIDSYIIATWLWKLTGRVEYLEDAHHIYYNAATHAQRTIGSFGTDFCLGAELAPHEPSVEYDSRMVQPRTYEVYWCCTMRGGEFFARACESVFMTSGNTLVLPFYHNNTATVKLAGGTVQLRETTGYPYNGTVRLEVLAASRPKTTYTVKFYLPSWRKRRTVKLAVNGKPVATSLKDGFLVARTRLAPGMVLSLDFGIKLHTEETLNANSTEGRFSFRHGPMILAVDYDMESEDAGPRSEAVSLTRDTELEYAGQGSWKVKGGDIVLSPLYRIDRLAKPNTRRQALFG